MAFFVENDAVYLTKGDDAVLEVRSIVTEAGDEYTLREGDVLTLTVRALPRYESPVLIQIDGLPGSKRIVIRHADTQDVAVGRYSADVQLTTAEGTRHTIWPTPEGSGRYIAAKAFNNFVIMPEVTDR